MFVFAEKVFKVVIVMIVLFWSVSISDGTKISCSVF